MRYYPQEFAPLIVMRFSRRALAFIVIALALSHLTAALAGSWYAVARVMPEHLGAVVAACGTGRP